MAENNTERLVAGAEGVLSMVGTPIGNLGERRRLFATQM